MPNEKKLPGGPAHSPKLKMAAKEIQDIFKKYDIAGVVQMFTPGTPGFNEYTMSLSPTWSCVTVDGAGKMQIHPPIEDPSDPGRAKKKIANTVNMVANMRIYVGNLYKSLTQADIAVRTYFGMMPKPGAPDIKPSENGQHE